MNEQEKPERTKAWMLLAFVGFFVLLFGVVYLGALFQHHRQPLPPALSSGHEGDFIHRPPEMPTPTPTPWPPAPAPTPPPIRGQYLPSPAPTLSMWDQHLIDLKHKAMEADVLVKLPTDNYQGSQGGQGNTLVTPSLTLNQSGTNAPNRVISLQTLPPHSIPPWSLMYAQTTTEIVSNHSGDVLARLTQPVKDATLSEILIPSGCIVHGTQAGPREIEETDYSVIVNWDQIACPNREPIDLPKVPSMSAEGLPGLPGDVNHHYLAVWTPAVVISAITAGMMLASHPTYGGLQGYSATQEALGAGADSLGGQAMAHLGTGLNIKPTITVPIGTLIRIVTTQVMTFDQPYQE
jgi:type IV secretory pathway VirB10-like protein